jgi:hypothetical protein
MAKEVTQVLKYPAAKKHSVQFKQKKSDKTPLFSSLYLMREGAAKLLGIKALDEVEEIEITVRVVK